MPSIAYNLEHAKRQPLTKKNLRELDIEQNWQSILDHPNLVYVDDNGVRHKPVGFSVNKSSFGAFPGTASQLGWLAYMNLGEPLIEERGNISQPPPDMFSTRTYANRSKDSTMTFTDSVDFTVSNAVTWSLQGQTQLTFGGSVSAQLQLQLQTQLKMDLQKQLQNEVASKNTNTVTNKNSPNSTGVDNANATEASVRSAATNSVTDSVAFTTQGTATGTATLNAQLMLGITASVGGTLTTSWDSKSQISGDVPPDSRVQTIVTQRRARKQYSYEIPVTFSGLIAVKYDVPVAVLSPPQSGDYPGLDQVVARDIGDLDLAGGGFRMKGLAEVVSALEVHHTMFDGESLTDSERALYKKP
ncbi:MULTISPECIES: hypothetical protein [Streptomyces]|uniref:hypothetical protein n=1 Tax=Streptomyces TaxID=1883 RepID=UPI0019631922|nr:MULTISPECIES: hypothetical protein [Streptomyces]QRX89635.1 hypothetical protein JNO44_01030 [Streptomyces noursei]UJB39652.1 hypothetical protein HRD51_00925 [Streptomyces sp. A1-5]